MMYDWGSSDLIATVSVSSQPRDDEGGHQGRGGGGLAWGFWRAAPWYWWVVQPMLLKIYGFSPDINPSNTEWRSATACQLADEPLCKNTLIFISLVLAQTSYARCGQQIKKGWNVKYGKCISAANSDRFLSHPWRNSATRLFSCLSRVTALPFGIARFQRCNFPSEFRRSSKSC